MGDYLKYVIAGLVVGGVIYGTVKGVKYILEEQESEVVPDMYDETITHTVEV